MLMPVSGAVIWRVDSRNGRLRSMMPMMSALTASGTTPGLSAVMMSSRARSCALRGAVGHARERLERVVGPVEQAHLAVGLGGLARHDDLPNGPAPRWRLEALEHPLAGAVVALLQRGDGAGDGREIDGRRGLCDVLLFRHLVLRFLLVAHGDNPRLLVRRAPRQGDVVDVDVLLDADALTGPLLHGKPAGPLDEADRRLGDDAVGDERQRLVALPASCETRKVMTEPSASSRRARPRPMATALCLPCGSGPLRTTLVGSTPSSAPRANISGPRSWLMIAASHGTTRMSSATQRGVPQLDRLLALCVADLVQNKDLPESRGLGRSAGSGSGRWARWFSCRAL